MSWLLFASIFPLRWMILPSDQKCNQEQFILPKIEECGTGVRQDSLHFNWACHHSDELVRNTQTEQTNSYYFPWKWWFLHTDFPPSGAPPRPSSGPQLCSSWVCSSHHSPDGICSHQPCVTRATTNCWFCSQTTDQAQEWCQLVQNQPIFEKKKKLCSGKRR